MANELNITRTIDNKGQNKSFIDGESKMKLKSERSHLFYGPGMWFVSVSMQLQRRYRKFFSFRDDEPSEELSRTGVEYVMNN